MEIERNHMVWGGVAVLAVGLVAVVEPIAEWKAEDELGSWASADRWSAEWGAVDWRWSGSLAVRDLEIDGPSGSRLKAANVAIPVLWPSLRAGAPRAGDIVVDRPTLEVEVPAGTDGRSGGRSGAPTSSSVRRTDVCARLDGVTWSRGRLTVRREGEVVVGARGAGEVACPSEGGVSFEAQGRVKSIGSRSRRRRVQLSGRARPSRGSATARLSFPGSEADEGARLRVGPAYASFEKANVSVQNAFDHPTIRGVLEGVELGVGRRGARAAKFRVGELAVERPSEGTVQIEADGPNVSVTPERLIREVVDVSTSSGASQSDGSGGSGLRWRRLAYRFLREVDLSVEGVALRVRLRDGSEWRVLEPTETLTLDKQGRHVMVGGEFAAGTVRGHAFWTPGLLVPRSASLQLREVDLAEVPVVREGRRLPARGVRGRVGGRLNAEASFVRSGTFSLFRTIRAKTSVQWRNGWAEAGGLAGETVEDLDVDLELEGAWHPALGRAELERGLLRYGPVNVALSGRLAGMPVAPVLTFRAEAETFECQRAVRSLPSALLGPYDDVTIEGEASPRLSFEFPWHRPAELTFDLDGFPGACHVTALHTDKSGWPDIRIAEPGPRSPPTASQSEQRRTATMPAPGDDEGIDQTPPELAPVPSTWSAKRPDDVFWLRKPFVKPVTEGVSEGAEVEVGPGLASYVPLAGIPEYASGASYLSEEINFYSDGPWNEHLVERALQMNFEEHRFVYGGSTVTQQLVKNLFLTRKKTLARKIQEAIVAWRLQGVVSKDRLLELYLNCIEYGNDLYGIGPAARHYFQVSARDLQPMEAVFLAAIKPAPWFGERFRSRGRTPEDGWWRNRFEEIFDRLVDRGFLTRQRAERARPYVLKWDDEGRAVHRKSNEGGDGTADEGADPLPPSFEFSPADEQ